MIKGWISMTKVACLFEEEKIEALNTQLRDLALKMILAGEDYLKVVEYTGLTREEVLKIQAQAEIAS